MDLLVGALEALSKGVISPFVFVALLILGLVIWAAAKFGDKLFGSVGGLLDVGEKVRQSLAAQIIASDARVVVFQQAADLAQQRCVLSQNDLAALTLRHEALQSRCARTAEDLQACQLELQDARAENARLKRQ